MKKEKGKCQKDPCYIMLCGAQFDRALPTGCKIISSFGKVLERISFPMGFCLVANVLFFPGVGGWAFPLSGPQ